MLAVFHRSSLLVDRASGCLVWDVDGRKYIDLTSGWGVTCLGHGYPALVESLSAQLKLGMQAPNCNLSYTRPQAEAAEKLIDIAPAGLTRVFFTNFGAEATEGVPPPADEGIGHDRDSDAAALGSPEPATTALALLRDACAAVVMRFVCTDRCFYVTHPPVSRAYRVGTTIAPGCFPYR